MRAAISHEPRRIEAGERPDASLREPTDAIVRVVLACVCGSDLWYYRGDSEFSPGPIGHEFIGVVGDIGSEVSNNSKDDRQQLATEFGATGLVAERGDEAVENIKEMTGGVGVDATLECVGTRQAMQ